MALTKDQILAALKKRGLTESYADHLTFETEEQLNAFVGSIPKKYNTYAEMLADEEANPILKQYGDKRVTDAKIKWEKDNPKPGSGSGSGNNETHSDIAGIVAKAVQDALKPVTDQVTKLENEKASELRIAKIKGLLVKEEIPTKVHDLVLNSIPSDADDTVIAGKIAEAKATLTELGLKDIGVPGSGGGGSNSTAKTEINNWGDKKKKKEQTGIK